MSQMSLGFFLGRDPLVIHRKVNRSLVDPKTPEFLLATDNKAGIDGVN